MIFLRTSLMVALFLCFGGAPLCAQRSFTPQQVREDLAFLQEALLHGHPGAGLYMPADSLRAVFRQLGDRLRGDSIPWAQAQLVIRLAVAAMRDGHTSVQTPFYDETTRVLPLSTFAVDDALFVAANHSADTTLARGTEITAVDGVPPADVLRIGRLMATADGYSLPFRQVYAELMYARLHTLLFGDRDTLAVSVLTPGGGARTSRVASIDRAALERLTTAHLKALPKGPEPVFRHKTMSVYRDTVRTDLAVLALRGFPTRGYKKFYRKSFQWMRDNGIRHLGVDLRYNTGGTLKNMNFLLASLIPESYSYRYLRKKGAGMGRYFRTKADLQQAMASLRYDVLPGFKRSREGDVKVRTRRIKPRKQVFDGNIWVLSNGFTFSAASMSASFLRDRRGAQVIGQESGGSAERNCGGSFPSLVLPNTGFKVRFPLYLLEYDVAEGPFGRGVLPDHPVTYTLSDRVARRDVERERLRAILERR
ncbi:MAG: S41 family peptidase [Saprospiraceae bacterium]|nr:S41 family peptidase [Saprospiraceae bacterium]